MIISDGRGAHMHLRDDPLSPITFSLICAVYNFWINAARFTES